MGQYTLLDHRLSTVGDPGVADRMGWPVDDLGTPVFDWRPEDGAVAYRGGAMAITGAPSYAAPTPWRDRAHTDLLSAEVTTAARLTTTGHVSEGDDACDFVVMALIHMRGPTSVPILLWDPGATRGIYFNITPAWLFNVSVAGNGWANGSAAIAVAPGWYLLSGLFRRSDGRAKCWVGATESAGGAVAAGGWGGVGLHAYVGYTTMAPSRIARVMAWASLGVGDLITAPLMGRLVEAIFGVRPLAGAIGATYARASTRCYYPLGPTGRLHLLGSAVPPAGGAEGRGADEQIISVTSKNHALAAADLATHITPLSDAGLTASLVDDSANLGPASEAGPLVVRVQNTTGGTLYQRLGNAIGGAPATSWASIRAREVAGPCRLGWHTAGGAFTQVAAALAAAYARTSGTALPAANTDRQAIELPAGADVYLILWCAGIGARVPDEVPSMAAAGASTTVAMGALTSTCTPASGEGSVEVVATPRGWSGAGAGTPGLLYLSGGGGAVLYVAGGSWRCAIDGTTALDSGVAPVDGAPHTIRLRWKTGLGMSIEVRDATGALLGRATGAYDGSLAAGGTWQLADNGGPAAVGGLRHYRNGGV